MANFVERLGESISTAVRSALAGRVGALDQRVVLLEQRLAEVEAGQAVYRGVWRDGATFPPGAMVTVGGSLWCAEAATSTRPGTAGSAWRLCVKAGAR
jgi:hypothetical protein